MQKNLSKNNLQFDKQCLFKGTEDIENEMAENTTKEINMEKLERLDLLKPPRIFI